MFQVIVAVTLVSSFGVSFGQQCDAGPNLLMNRMSLGQTLSLDWDEEAGAQRFGSFICPLTDDRLGFVEAGPGEPNPWRAKQQADEEDFGYKEDSAPPEPKFEVIPDEALGMESVTFQARNEGEGLSRKQLPALKRHRRHQKRQQLAFPEGTAGSDSDGPKNERHRRHQKRQQLALSEETVGSDSDGLKNEGRDCARPCKYRGGYCEYCGTGRCCLASETETGAGWFHNSPQECKGATHNQGGAVCVAAGTNPVATGVFPMAGSILGATPVTVFGHNLYECHDKVANSGSVSSLQPPLRIFVLVGSTTIECALETQESRPTAARCTMPALARELMNASDVEHPVVVLRRQADGSYDSAHGDNLKYQWSTGATPMVQAVSPQVAGPGDVLTVQAWGCAGLFEYSPIDLVPVRAVKAKKEEGGGTPDGAASELVDDGEEAFAHVCERWPPAADEEEKTLAEEAAAEGDLPNEQEDLPGTIRGQQGISAKLWTWAPSEWPQSGQPKSLDEAEEMSQLETYDHIWLADRPHNDFVLEDNKQVLAWYRDEQKNYFIYFDGWMRVEQNGTYTLTMFCTSQCRLRVGHYKMDKDERHWRTSTNEAEMPLSVGWHRIQVYHHGSAGRLTNRAPKLRFWYNGPDTEMEKVELPAKIFRSQSPKKVLKYLDTEAKKGGPTRKQPSIRVPWAGKRLDVRACPSGTHQRLYEFSCKVSRDMEPGFYDLKVHDYTYGGSTESVSARWKTGMGNVSATLRIVPKVEKVSLLQDGRLHVRGAGLDHLPAAQNASGAGAAITYGDKRYKVYNHSQDHLDLIPDGEAPGTATRLGSRGMARQVWLRNQWPVKQISLDRPSTLTRSAMLRTGLPADGNGTADGIEHEGFAERLSAVLMPPYTGECRFRIQGTQAYPHSTLNEAKLYLAEQPMTSTMDTATFPAYPVVYTNLDEERTSVWMPFEKDRAYPMQLERRLGVADDETGNDGWKMVSFECRNLEGEGAKLLPAPEEIFKITLKEGTLDNFDLSRAQDFDVLLHASHPWVFYQGQLHPVCGHWLWDNPGAVAQVICRQIGETGGEFHKTRERLPSPGARFNTCNDAQAPDLGAFFVGVESRGHCRQGDHAGIKITCNGVENGASPSIVRKPADPRRQVVRAELRKWPAWSRGVQVLSETNSIAVNVGRETFNRKFSECPVVKYTRDGAVSMVYVRLTPLPGGFDAYESFTKTWASHPGAINQDFALYPTVEAAKNGATEGRLDCNLRTKGGGFPGECHVNKWVGGQYIGWQNFAFKMPEHGGPSGVSKDAGLEVLRGSCFSPLGTTATMATAEFLLNDTDATIAQNLEAAGMPPVFATVVKYGEEKVLDLQGMPCFASEGHSRPEDAFAGSGKAYTSIQYPSVDIAMRSYWMVKLPEPVHIKSIYFGCMRDAKCELSVDGQVCGNAHPHRSSSVPCDVYGSTVKVSKPQSYYKRLQVFDFAITVYDQSANTSLAAPPTFGIQVKYDYAGTDRIVFSSAFEEGVRVTTKSSGSRLWSRVTDYWFRVPHREEQVIFGDWRDYICEAVDEDGCAPVHSDEPPATPPALLQSHTGRQHKPGTRRNALRRWRLPFRYHTPESLDLLRRRVLGYATRPVGWKATEALLQQHRSGKHREHRDGGLHDPRNDTNTSAHLRWSDPNSWGGEVPPNKDSTDIVLIPEGKTAILDMNVNIKFWVIEGNLLWDLERDIHMEAECIIVNGGQLLIGSKERPFRKRGELLFHGHWHSFKLPLVGTKGLFETRGLVEMFGEPIKHTWVELNTTAQKGEQHIKLRQTAADWLPGSLLVVAPSDAWPTACRLDRRDDCQAEERYVQEVHDNGFTIRLDRPLVYRHVAEELDPHMPAEYCNETQDHPEYCGKTQVRAEVGLLTRNIRVVGANYDEGTGPPGTEGYGAHLLHAEGARYSHVEFYWVGQAFQMGRYPLHYHMGGVNPTSYVDGCAIHRSFNRGITLHGTHNVAVKRNVVYSHMGHGYFLEGGNEHNNLFQDNLGLLTMVSMTMLLSDMGPATFWFRNPQNHIIGNHAAGSCAKGMWWDTADVARPLLLGEVRDNVVHTNPQGMWFEVDSRKDCYAPDDWTISSTHTDTSNIDHIQVENPPACGWGFGRALVHVNSTTSWGNGHGLISAESGHVHYRNFRGVCDGNSLQIWGLAADHWPDPTNGFDGPTILYPAFHTRSQLNSAGFGMQSAILTGWDDGLFITGAQFVGPMGKVAIGTCVNCLAAEGGYHIRTSKLDWWEGAGTAGNARVGFRWHFSSNLFDFDGTLTTLKTQLESELEDAHSCRVRGCYLHSPMHGGMYSRPRGVQLLQVPEMHRCDDELVFGIYYGGRRQAKKIFDGVRLSASSEKAGHAAANMFEYWAAAHQDRDQWFQIDVGTIKWVAGVRTKGRPDADHWVTYYNVSYSEDGVQWTTLPRHFKGNEDRHHEKINQWVPFKARFVRLLIDEWNRFISLRDVSLFGCDGSINMTAVCVDKPYRDDRGRNCRSLARSQYAGAQCESKIVKWTAYSIQQACCYCGGGEPLSVDTPQEKGDDIFVKWGDLPKFVPGGTGYLPPELCQGVDETGGIVCDHRAKLRSVTVNNLGNWHKQTPMTIQTDYGFDTTAYIDCYGHYEFTVFEDGRFMLVPPYTLTSLVDMTKMSAAVDMEEGDRWVLQIETIHNPTGFTTHQMGVTKMAICDEGQRSPHPFERSAKFLNRGARCESEDCKIYNCHGEILLGPRFNEDMLENSLDTVKNQTPFVIVKRQMGGVYNCDVNTASAFGDLGSLCTDSTTRSWAAACDWTKNPASALRNSPELKCFCDTTKNMPLFYRRETFENNKTLRDALAKHTDIHSAVVLGLNLTLDLYKVAHIPLLDSASMANSAANWGYLQANESYVLKYWYPGTFSMLVGSQGVSHGMHGRDGAWDGRLRPGEKEATHIIKRDGDLALARRFSRAFTPFSWKRWYYLAPPDYPLAPTWLMHLERYVDCMAPGLASEEVASSLQHLGVPLSTLQNHPAVTAGRLNVSAIRRFRWSEWPADLGGRPHKVNDTGDGLLDEAMGYGNITIQPNWEVTLDVDVDFINKLNISGVLKFADQAGCCRIVARYIFVGPYVGRLEAGTAEKPFRDGYAHIVLKGHPMTPYLKTWEPNLANFPTCIRSPQALGVKYLAVQGTLSLFSSGHERNQTWAKLKQSVSTGSKRVRLDGGNFTVGDTVTIDRGWDILRVVNVTQEGDTVELEFDHALKHDYRGIEYQFPNRPETAGWMYSVVGVIDGHNIVIEGEDTPGVPMCHVNRTHQCPYASGLPMGMNLHDFAKELRARIPGVKEADAPRPGCRKCLAISDMGFGGKVLGMLYATMYDKQCPVTHGVIHVSGVVFKHSARLNLYHNYEPCGDEVLASPRDEHTEGVWNDRPNKWWRDPLWSVELGRDGGLGEPEMLVTKNAINNTMIESGLLQVGGYGTILAIMRARDFTQNVFYSSGSPPAWMQEHVGITAPPWKFFTDQIDPEPYYFTARENFFSGSECTSRPGVLVTNNFFTNTVYMDGGFKVLDGVGANDFKDNIVSGPTASGNCIKTDIKGRRGVADNLVHSCGTGLKFESEYSIAGVVTRMTILNCGKGVSYHTRHVAADSHSQARQEFLIENTVIYSRIEGTGFGVNNPHVHSSLAWNARCCPRSDHRGCATPPFKPLGRQSLFFKSYITDVTFIGFRHDKGGRAIAHGYGAHQQGDSDVHPIYVQGLQFEDMDQDARLYVRGAHSKGFGIKRCIGIECGANRNMLIHDLDGSLTGNIGTVIPGYDKFWDKLHYASPLGFENPEDLIPFAQRYDQVGDAIPFPTGVNHGTGGDLIYECKADSRKADGQPGCDVLFMNGPRTPMAGYWTPKPERAAGLAPGTRIIATREDGGLIRLDPIHHGWNYATGWVMTNLTNLLAHYKGIPKPESQHARRYGRVGPNEFGAHINTSRVNATRGPVYTKAGIYRKGCTWNGMWNAYTCPGGRHFHLVIETMDVDHLSRRRAPVTVEVNDDYRQQGGYLNMLTDPTNTGLPPLQTFWALGHTNMRHNIYFTSDPPRHVRFSWDGPRDEGIVFMMYYGVPNNIVGYVAGKRVEPIATILWDNPIMPVLNASMPHGTYFYDRIGMESGRPGYLYGVLKGGGQYMDFKITSKVILTTKVNASTNWGGWKNESGDNFYNKGIGGLTRNLAFLIGTPPSRVKILGEGSARKGTFWNEETTSKKFAEFMWKQNKSLSDQDREDFLKRYMKEVGGGDGDPDKPSTPDYPSLLQHPGRERRHIEFLQRFPTHRHGVITGALSRHGRHLAGDRFQHHVGLLSTEEMEAVVAHQQEQELNDAEEMEMFKLAKMQLTKQRQAHAKPHIDRLRNETGIEFIDIEVEVDDDYIGQERCDKNEATSCGAFEDDHVNLNEEDTEKRAMRLLTMVTQADGGGASLLQEAGSQSQRSLLRARQTVAKLLRDQGIEIIGASVDDVPRMGLPTGWLCPAPKYNDGTICDCDCGIWDPDCDLVPERQQVKAIWDKEAEDLRLLDAEQVFEVMKQADGQYNGNGAIDGAEVTHVTFWNTSALKVLAREIIAAQASGTARSPHRYGNVATLDTVETPICNTAILELRVSAALADYTPVCVKDSEFKLVAGAASGRCELLPTMKIGSQCKVHGGSQIEVSEGSTVCGPENKMRCIASMENTWDYTCEEAPVSLRKQRAVDEIGSGDDDEEALAPPIAAPTVAPTAPPSVPTAVPTTSTAAPTAVPIAPAEYILVAPRRRCKKGMFGAKKIIGYPNLPGCQALCEANQPRCKYISHHRPKGACRLYDDQCDIHDLKRAPYGDTYMRPTTS